MTDEALEMLDSLINEIQDHLNLDSEAKVAMEGYVEKGKHLVKRMQALAEYVKLTDPEVLDKDGELQVCLGGIYGVHITRNHETCTHPIHASELFFGITNQWLKGGFMDS